MECCAGGAKGIDSFVDSVASGNLPPEGSIAHEGLYYNYFFETGEEKEKLFRCAFTSAISKDPFSKNPEYYVCAGLNSRNDGEGLYKHGGRPALNIVLILDISGSMNGSFDWNESKDSKLDVAKKIIISAIMPKLNDKDSLGLVLFDDKAYITQPLVPIASINLSAFKSEIMKINTKGGTTMEAGMRGGTNQFAEFFKKYPDRVGNENRIFFLTDATPNNGDSDTNKMLEFMKANQAKKIFTSFVGLGVDFNIELVNILTKLKATNYFSVKSAAEFSHLMDKEFDYIVSADVFDVVVQCVDGGFEVERVYGSPGYEIPKSGIVFEMNSGFPSLKEDPNTTKGGVVLIKLKPKSGWFSSTDISKPIKLKFKTTYCDREGKKFDDYQELDIPGFTDSDVYSGTAARKAILLTRYVNFMKQFIRDQKANTKHPYDKLGIPIPQVKDSKSSDYGSPMKELEPAYLTVVEKFREYFTKEADALSDAKLLNELELVNKIVDTPKKSTKNPHTFVDEPHFFG